MKTNFKRLHTGIAIGLAALLGQGTPDAATPAFPTAEGFGRMATGGRGGKVVEVTTLQDNVAGSLRWALAQYPGQPITIVFRVSGVIDLANTPIRATRTAGLTIAGQTAPGDGICVKGAKINLGGSTNVVIRHMRFRVGLQADGSFIEGGAIGFENGGNFIFDHCTFGWSGEENTTIYDDTAFTIQWSIIHEGLYDVGHPKGARSYGAQWGGQSSTYHHNLLANNVSRSPRFNGARSNDDKVLIDYVNNVNYNWGRQNSCYGGDIENTSNRINMVGNYYKPGAAFPGTKKIMFVQSSYASGQGNKIAVWHLSDNYMEGSANTALNSDNYSGLDVDFYVEAIPSYTKSQSISKTAFPVKYPVTTQTAQEAYKSVLKNAGAFPRDKVDQRIVNEVSTGTSTGKGNFNGGAVSGIIDNPSVVGGYPTYKTYNTVKDDDHDGMDDAWEKSNGLDPANASDGNTIGGKNGGYTNLEVYLNGLAGEFTPGFNYQGTNSVNQDNSRLPESVSRVEAHLDGKRGTLWLSSADKVRSVAIFDVAGSASIVRTGTDIRNLDIGTLANGLYIARVATTGSKSQSIKFIK